MTINKALESRVRSEDLLDLLDHIAWTQTIRPRLETTRREYQDLLVSATIGNAAYTLTPTELAGRCYGINYAITLIEDILKNGEQASKLIAADLAK